MAEKLGPKKIVAIAFTTGYVESASVARLFFFSTNKEFDTRTAALVDLAQELKTKYEYENPPSKYATLAKCCIKEFKDESSKFCRICGVAKEDTQPAGIDIEEFREWIKNLTMHDSNSWGHFQKFTWNPWMQLCDIVSLSVDNFVDVVSHGEDFICAALKIEDPEVKKQLDWCEKNNEYDGLPSGWKIER